MIKRYFAEWVWPRRRQVVQTLLLTACLAAATAGYPTVIKLSFDSLMNQTGVSLGWILAAIVGITAVRSFFLYHQTVSAQRLVLGITTDMQKTAFRHLVNADFARLSRETPGRLVSRLTNDISFIQSALSTALNSLCRDSLTVIALIGAMLYLDWAMTLVVLCVYPLAAIPIATIGRRLRGVAKRMQSGLGDMTSLLSEQLGAARLIKSYQLEPYASDRLSTSFEDIFQLRMKQVKTRARMDPMLETLGGLAIAGVVSFAYLRISTGISTVGDFMGFVTALLMAAQPIRQLGNLAGRLQEGLAAAESYYGMIDEKPKIVDKAETKPLIVTRGDIDFRNVSFGYTGDANRPAVSDFTLTIPGGSTVALVGRSGGGKSTVMNLVPRLFDVDKGSIVIDGQDVRDVTLVSLRNAIAIVSQDITLFDDTIAANIALGRIGATRDEIVAAAKAAAADEFIRAQPNGYDTIIGASGGRLSGGQRQRLALARAILKNAPILLLDEATSALDNESEQLVRDALAEFTIGRTCLVIAHRLSTVQNADIICVMEDGRLVEQGSHNELLSQSGAYARLSSGANGDVLLN